MSVEKKNKKKKKKNVGVTITMYISRPQAGFEPPIARTYSSTECKSITIQATTAGNSVENDFFGRIATNYLTPVGGYVCFSNS